MFLKNCWYVAATPAELTQQDFVSRRILGERILLFQASNGEAVAFQDRCPHRIVPLSAGKRVGDTLQCGYHGMVFGTDGRCVHIPGQDRIPDTARVRTYPLELRHAHLWIWMGDRQLADPALIPMVPWPALDGWALASGYTHIAADYRLLSDNLLDLSHENYIHEKTIGNDASESIADFPARISVVDKRVVRADRTMANIDPPPFFRLMMGSSGRINRWQSAIWTAPSVNITDVGAYAVGSAPESASRSFVLHLLTPETENSSHYFWSHNRNFRIDDVALTEAISQAMTTTFEEDKDMLELQQRELLDDGGPIPRVALVVDDAPLRARRLLASMIRQEESDGQVAVGPNQQLVDEDAVLSAA